MIQREKDMGGMASTAACPGLPCRMILRLWIAAVLAKILPRTNESWGTKFTLKVKARASLRSAGGCSKGVT